MFTESVIVAVITRLCILVSIVMSNSKNRVVMKVKIDALAKKIGEHNQLVERTYHIEEALAVAQNNIKTLCERTKA